jgi:hypothetical protein
MTVRCANGHDNPDGQSFCGECGTTLQRAVLKCANGHDNIPGQRYCGECGASLTQAPAGGELEGSPVLPHKTLVRSDTRTGRSRFLSWPRTHWRLTLLGCWLVVAAAVAALLLLPYNAHVRSSPLRVVPRVGSSETDTLSFSVPCGAPIIERFTEIPPSGRASTRAALRDALVSDDITVRSETGSLVRGSKELGNNGQRDLTQIELGLRTVCQGPATPRLALAGGVLVVAVVGTWLFLNLTSDRRPTRA